MALAAGLGWGIRGDFGHLLGASYPGAALGLAFAFVTGQASMFRWMPIVGAAGGIGIAMGGMMSYGMLHGYAQSDTLINYGYGFLTLFLEGGAWGGFGGALIALALESPRLRMTEWATALAATLASGFVFHFIVCGLFGFEINPSRGNETIAFTGGIIGLCTWLVLSGKSFGFKGLLFGYVGFGIGMSLGRLFGNIAHVLPIEINHWNVMETSCGLIGGFTYAYGMLGRKFEDPPKTLVYKALSVFGILYVMAGIPLFHRLLRAKPEDVLEHVTAAAGSMKVTNPEAFSQSILLAINVVCILGFVGGAIWLYLNFNDKTRFAAFPVLAFSGVMLLFQEINCLYPFVPTTRLTVDMHTVFLVLYALMVGFVVFWRPTEQTVSDKLAFSVNWRRWVGGTVVVYILILIAASFINGDKTMTTANTRWPIWSWNKGPFPGREAAK